MNRILRLSSLILALVVTIGLMATTMAPAQAQPQSPGRCQAIHTGTTVSGDQDVQPRSTGAARADDHGQAIRAADLLHGPRLLRWVAPRSRLVPDFNRSRQADSPPSSLATATAFICAGTALITCGAAVGIAAAIQRYVDRNGVCPTSRPKMRVEYSPRPGRVGCA